ncbi:MAM domain-containing glycosylphosphatidylinositol anchor protein 1 [Elysia marginata]|uniref:MAM domain-containing glycosylphosphatidylinositol anchor protein 1 n=1 Tax=Elysia marginata TaxID=1093978 RepID=A0AAV4HV15_9GAST|nr:MAM domain-containing glycosylphosphatidylinositol anchor protein 1 [Elysia marginata]
MYIEASAKGRGSNAILYSPLYRGMSEQCLEFFYHMYGRHIGTLNVYAQARGDTLNVAWRAYGNQGDHWTNARLAIPRELARAGYQIAFEGITENGYQGDISIDDVSVTDGPCPVDEKIVAVRVEVNSTSVLRSGRTFTKKLRRKMRKRRGRQ